MYSGHKSDFVGGGVNKCLITGKKTNYQEIPEHNYKNCSKYTYFSNRHGNIVWI